MIRAAAAAAGAAGAPQAEPAALDALNQEVETLGHAGAVTEG